MEKDFCGIFDDSFIFPVFNKSFNKKFNENELKFSEISERLKNIEISNEQLKDLTKKQGKEIHKLKEELKLAKEEKEKSDHQYKILTEKIERTQTKSEQNSNNNQKEIQKLKRRIEKS